ncbi:DivIVA domain-containing protein [Demequina sp.]|uniref:DivIVA domain-containing protein n=1 Tax=Demequina sp. TaxID=2050685 RepID=UPI0026003CB3|nr:DivIVA domain-containing protein [Demequina sp.]
MAVLTAEDVLNKAFSKTKYREGFDQDEVDDFLDEVAQTISQLTSERDELAARLQEAQAGGAPVAPVDAPAPSSGLLQAATDPNPPTPTGMLAMAQKLHDEYVSAGEEEKERLVEEGKAKAESIVERAEQDAQSRMDQLTSERSLLETKIDDLRRFERDYRSRLKSYLSNLLGDLDHAEGTAPAPVATFVGEDLMDDEVPAGEADGDEDDAVEANVEEPAVDEHAGESWQAAPVDEESTEAPADDHDDSAGESADEEPERTTPFAPVTGGTPAVGDAPYSPQSTQYGTPYTPQNPWAQPAEGEGEQRD